MSTNRRVSVLEKYIRNIACRLKALESGNTEGAIISIDSVDIDENQILTITFTSNVGVETVSTDVSELIDFQVKYNVLNFNELQTINDQVLYDFAYVRQAQGTSWLPGSLGGTYYGAGLYMWDGTDWIEDDTDVFAQLENLINNKIDNKTVTTVSTNYVALITDRVILVDTSSGDVLITLPSTTALDSLGIIVKKIDTSVNKIVINSPNTETIDNLPNREISTYLQSRTIITDGTNYWQI